ncbi:hypothetical protein K439DRAFT_987949 [Ramaria rubella]|nr:hypothetical protein K439DRAFT_987949 [Ramaria rubella]
MWFSVKELCPSSPNPDVARGCLKPTDLNFALPPKNYQKTSLKHSLAFITHPLNISPCCAGASDSHRSPSNVQIQDPESRASFKESGELTAAGTSGRLNASRNVMDSKSEVSLGGWTNAILASGHLSADIVGVNSTFLHPTRYHRSRIIALTTSALRASSSEKPLAPSFTMPHQATPRRRNKLLSGPVTCDHCPDHPEFAHRHSLRGHFRTVHLHCLETRCDDCSVLYSRPDSYKRHLTGGKCGNVGKKCSKRGPKRRAP